MSSVYTYANDKDIETKKQEIYNYFVYNYFINPKTNQYLNIESQILDTSNTPYSYPVRFTNGKGFIEVSNFEHTLYMKFMFIV